MNVEQTTKMSFNEFVLTQVNPPMAFVNCQLKPMTNVQSPWSYQLAYMHTLFNSIDDAVDELFDSPAIHYGSFAYTNNIYKKRDEMRVNKL